MIFLADTDHMTIEEGVSVVLGGVSVVECFVEGWMRLHCYNVAQMCLRPPPEVVGVVGFALNAYWVRLHLHFYVSWLHQI